MLQSKITRVQTAPNKTIPASALNTNLGATSFGKYLKYYLTYHSGIYTIKMGQPQKSGITLSNWKALGKDKDGDGKIDEKDLKLISQADVYTLLKANFWDAIGGSKIRCISLAYLMMEDALLKGDAESAIQDLQEALGLTKTGAMTDDFIASLNGMKSQELFNFFMSFLLQQNEKINARNQTLRQTAIGQLGRIKYGALVTCDKSSITFSESADPADAKSPSKKKSKTTVKPTTRKPKATTTPNPEKKETLSAACLEDYMPYFLSYAGGYIPGTSNYGITIELLEIAEMYINGDDVINDEDLQLLDPMIVEYVLQVVFWDTLQAGKLQSQSIANQLMDWSTIAGVEVVVKNIQKLLNIDVTGAMNQETLDAINKQDRKTLFQTIQSSRINAHSQQVQDNPTMAQYLSTWISRTMGIGFGTMQCKDGELLQFDDFTHQPKVYNDETTSPSEGQAEGTADAQQPSSDKDDLTNSMNDFNDLSNIL